MKGRRETLKDVAPLVQQRVMLRGPEVGNFILIEMKA